MNFIIAALFLIPWSASFAQFQDPQSILSATQETLARASELEASSGKKDNAAIFARMLKRSKQITLQWGQDVLDRCIRNETQGVVYAYTILDPEQKRHRFINVCAFAVEHGTHSQMIYVILHELAHQWGVGNEAEANFVADRAFSLMGWANPFLYRDARDYLNLIAAVTPTLKQKVAAIYAQDPNLEAYIPFLKADPDHWSEKDQAFDASPYKNLRKRSSATSVHKFFRFGGIVLTKTRRMSL